MYIIGEWIKSIKRLYCLEWKLITEEGSLSGLCRLSQHVRNPREICRKDDGTDLSASTDLSGNVPGIVSAGGDEDLAREADRGKSILNAPSQGIAVA